MKMRQAFALLCAGAMIITGSTFPVNVQASAGWTWNKDVSESGYMKVPHTLEFPQFYPQTSVFTSSIINNFQKMPKI